MSSDFLMLEIFDKNAVCRVAFKVQPSEEDRQTAEMELMRLTWSTRTLENMQLLRSHYPARHHGFCLIWRSCHNGCNQKVKKWSLVFQTKISLGLSSVHQHIIVFGRVVKFWSLQSICEKGLNSANGNGSNGFDPWRLKPYGHLCWKTKVPKDSMETQNDGFLCRVHKDGDSARALMAKCPTKAWQFIAMSQHVFWVFEGTNKMPTAWMAMVSSLICQDVNFSDTSGFVAVGKVMKTLMSFLRLLFFFSFRIFGFGQGQKEAQARLQSFEWWHVLDSKFSVDSDFLNMQWIARAQMVVTFVQGNHSRHPFYPGMNFDESMYLGCFEMFRRINLVSFFLFELTV